MATKETTSKAGQSIYPSENPQKQANNPEPVTQVQRDSVITREDIPPLGFRIGVTAVGLGILLFVAGLYFGNINP